MKWADSPRAVAAAADVILLRDEFGRARAITDGPDWIFAGSGKGKIIVDMSTVSVSTSRALAAKVREKGADMVDSPVSGTVATLQQGKLSVMVGGQEGNFRAPQTAVRGFLRSSGHGPRTQGHLRGRERAGAGDENCHESESGGADAGVFRRRCCWRKRAESRAQTAVDVLTHSAIASPMVQYRGPFVLKLPEKAWFNVNMMQKDMLLALELGRQVDVPLPTTAAANEILTAREPWAGARGFCGDVRRAGQNVGSKTMSTATQRPGANAGDCSQPS